MALGSLAGQSQSLQEQWCNCSTRLVLRKGGSYALSLDLCICMLVHLGLDHCSLARGKVNFICAVLGISLLQSCQSIQ